MYIIRNIIVIFSKKFGQSHEIINAFHVVIIVTARKKPLFHVNHKIKAYNFFSKFESKNHGEI